MVEQRSQDTESTHVRGTKATFVTVDFGYKNLFNTERPTSEELISIYLVSVLDKNKNNRRAST